MPTFRVTFNFVGQDGGGWNEVYYQDGGTISSVNLSIATISARAALLHPLNRWRTVRIVQVDSPRVTRNQQVNQGGTANAAGTGPLSNGDAVVVLLSSLAGGSRKLWLRGCPAAFMLKDPVTGVDIPPAELQKRLGYYYATLAADGFGIRQLQGITPGPLTPIKILKVDGSAANGTSVVTLASAPGYPFPSRVLIGGASKKDLPALNGQFSLVSAPAGALVTIPYQTPQSLVVNGGNAKMRQALYTSTHVFDPPSCGFDHFGTHATRTVNFRSRGARRAARLRTSL